MRNSLLLSMFGVLTAGLAAAQFPNGGVVPLPPVIEFERLPPVDPTVSASQGFSPPADGYSANPPAAKGATLESAWPQAWSEAAKRQAAMDNLWPQGQPDTRWPASGADVTGVPGAGAGTLRKAAPAEAEAAKTKLWEGSFGLGLDGSEGNTNTFNFRFGFDAKRKTKQNVFSVNLDYRKKTDDEIETTNRAFLDWRYERFFGTSRWTHFVHGTVDYDEFQSFDVRVTADTGLGYRWIKTETTSFISRTGAGVSHEIGGPQDNYVPEAIFGLDFEHRLSERQKLKASIDYMPDMTAMNDFRLKSRADWEMLIDQQMNLSVKLGVVDRYDSTPNGARPNDLDYSALLLWKF